jgi:hypothetical protein
VLAAAAATFRWRYAAAQLQQVASAARQQQPTAQASSSPQPRSYRDMTRCVEVVSATYSSGEIRVVITNICGKTIRSTVTHYRNHDTGVDGETTNLAAGAFFTFGGPTDRNWYRAVEDNNIDWAVTGQGLALEIPNSSLDKYPIK